MKHKLSMVLAVMASCLFFFTSAMSAEKMTDSENVNQKITRFMQDNQVSGVAVEMYVDGQAQSYYFGMANTKKKIPVSGQTIFELGSITKLMTSLVLAQEVDSAKVQFNQPVKKFLPTLSTKLEKMTLQDLATYTGGLPFDLPTTIKTPAELQHYLSKLEPIYAPEQKWLYSNVSMGLLGQALEKVTHKGINQLYRKKIFEPLHMQASGITLAGTMRRFYAQGYDVGGKPTELSKTGLLPAAGSIKASANDMRHFLSAAIGLPGTPETIFYPIRMTETAYVELPHDLQGLGWVVNSLTPERVDDLVEKPVIKTRAIKVKEVYTKPMFDGDALIDKTGMTNGFRAYIALIPNKKTGIVILANRAVTNNDIVSVGRKILFAANQIHGETQQEVN